MLELIKELVTALVERVNGYKSRIAALEEQLREALEDVETSEEEIQARIDAAKAESDAKAQQALERVNALETAEVAEDGAEAEILQALKAALES